MIANAQLPRLTDSVAEDLTNLAPTLKGRHQKAIKLKAQTHDVFLLATSSASSTNLCPRAQQARCIGPYLGNVTNRTELALAFGLVPGPAVGTFHKLVAPAQMMMLVR